MEVFTQPYIYVSLVFGLLIGSFLNVCIYRLPRENFWAQSRSYCPSCKKLIPFYDNIPLLSYIILLGKCRWCKSKISMQYPLVELLTGIFFAITYWKFPFYAIDDGTMVINALDLQRYFHAIIFSSCMIIATFVDIEHYIIPDQISLGLVVTGPIISYFHPELSLSSSLLGIVIGGGFLYAIAWLYWFIKKQIGMGMGDVKLLAGIGAWLGFESLLQTILVGSIFGSVVGIVVIIVKKNAKQHIPFGPFLAIGCLSFLYLGPQVFEWIGLVQTDLP